VFGHGGAERVVQRRLEVDRAQGCGVVRCADGVGGNPVLVHRERDKGDAEARRDALDHGVGERFHSETFTDRDKGRDRGGDCLPTVASEQHA